VCPGPADWPWRPPFRHAPRCLCQAIRQKISRSRLARCTKRGCCFTVARAAGRGIMPTHGFTRRAALLGLGAFASAQAAVHAQTSGFRIRAIEVDTSPLLAQSGKSDRQLGSAGLDQSTPAGLRERRGAGGSGRGDAPCAHQFHLSGRRRLRRPRHHKGSRDARGPHGAGADNRGLQPSPVDQAMWEQANRDRVAALAQSFAYSLKRKLRL